MWEFYCKGDFSCNVLGNRGATHGHVFIKICHPLVVAQGKHVYTQHLVILDCDNLYNVFIVNIKAPLIQACIMPWCVPLVCNIHLLCVSGALQLFFFWNSRVLKRKKKDCGCNITQNVLSNFRLRAQWLCGLNCRPWSHHNVLYLEKCVVSGNTFSKKKKKYMTVF